jgi:hypothetical protein
VHRVTADWGWVLPQSRRRRRRPQALTQTSPPHNSLRYYVVLAFNNAEDGSQSEEVTLQAALVQTRASLAHRSCRDIPSQTDPS